MIKRTLLAVIALAVMSVCSTSLKAQDVFVTFAPGTTSNTGTADVADGTGTAFVFVNNGFELDGFSVDLTAGDGSVARITSSTVVNSGFGILDATRFNNGAVDLNANGVLDGDEVGDIFSIPGIVNAAANSTTFEALSINQRGIVGPVLASFDEGFDAVANAFLLARIDFDIVGAGTAEFALQTTTDPVFAGPTGFVTIPENVELSPVFGNGTLTVTDAPVPVVPEPTSAGLLTLGLIGVVARRRRS